MKTNDLPNAPSIIKKALQEKCPAIKIIKRYTTGNNEKHKLLARVWRYLDKNSGGDKLKDLLLKQGSQHRLNAAVQLVTPAIEEDNENPIVNLIADAGVPIMSIAKSGEKDDRSTYSYWYTQLKRTRPEAMDYLKSKEAPDLSLQTDSILSNIHVTDNYFQFTDYELSD
jgi:hypothetical protein